MTITDSPQAPPFELLPELIDADRRAAKYLGREPLDEETLRWFVLRTKERSDELHARGVPWFGPRFDDDPYGQKHLAWRWNDIIDGGMQGQEEAA